METEFYLSYLVLLELELLGNGKTFHISSAFPAAGLIGGLAATSTIYSAASRKPVWLLGNAARHPRC